MGQGGAAVCTRPTRRSMWIGECRCTTQGDKMFRAGGNTTPGESVGRMWSSEVPNEWRTGRDFEWRTTPGRPSWLSRGGGTGGRRVALEGALNDFGGTQWLWGMGGGGGAQSWLERED